VREVVGAQPPAVKWVQTKQILTSHLVSCPDHTSHEENGLVNQVEFLGLEVH